MRSPPTTEHGSFLANVLEVCPVSGPGSFRARVLCEITRFRTPQLIEAYCAELPPLGTEEAD